MIGEWLYGLTPRDQQQTPIQSVVLQAVSTGTNNLLTWIRPPQAFILLVGRLNVWIETDDILSEVTNYTLAVQRPDGIPPGPTVLDRYRRNLEGGNFRYIKREFVWPLGLVIDAFYQRLAVGCDFSPNSGPNSRCELHVQGYLLPRGNVAPGAVDSSQGLVGS